MWRILRSKIKIEEAKANLEAEKLNAQAEIERAKGAAEAIRIENGSITPTYIQYLWVRQQSDLSNKTVIYVPTETNLPILESTRALTLPQEYNTYVSHPFSKEAQGWFVI